LDLVKREEKQVSENREILTNNNDPNNSAQLNSSDKPSYIFKVNLKRRLMNANNEVIEKFLSSEDVAIDRLTFKFSTWYQINIE